MKRHRCLLPPRAAGPALAAALLALLLLTGCAGVYVDPGASPARVRVQLDITPDRGLLPVDGGEASRVTSWEWGLYLVAGDGRLLPLAPESKQRLRGIPAERLVTDTVFLVPPGRQRLRLLAEGYVLMRLHLGATPYNVALWQEDLEMDLAPGQEITISRAQVGRK